jgi:hypothetical protein
LSWFSLLGEERNALFESAADVETIVDPKEAAEFAGLRYVSDARPGISRRLTGKGFTYTLADGSNLAEADVLKRINSLAITARLDRCLDLPACRRTHSSDRPGCQGLKAVSLPPAVP